VTCQQTQSTPNSGQCVWKSCTVNWPLCQNTSVLYMFTVAQVDKEVVYSGSLKFVHTILSAPLQVSWISCSVSNMLLVVCVCGVGTTRKVWLRKPEHLLWQRWSTIPQQQRSNWICLFVLTGFGGSCGRRRGVWGKNYQDRIRMPLQQQRPGRNRESRGTWWRWVWWWRKQREPRIWFQKQQPAEYTMMMGLIWREEVESRTRWPTG